MTPEYELATALNRLTLVGVAIRSLDFDTLQREFDRATSPQILAAGGLTPGEWAKIAGGRWGPILEAARALADAFGPPDDPETLAIVMRSWPLWERAGEAG